ncbi:fibronectin type III domain-containing protein [Vagococcus sp. WN89Y]|uniref:fibronectin type III domain-containing protein n=1 Tax=Vagococcus sp. WN89Y TaxID=3457258 RepID=UPI003FCDFD21
MPVEVSPSTNTGLTVENSGTPTTRVVGQLSPELTPIADGESVSFTVGLGSSTGGLTADVLSTAYYVNGMLAQGGGDEGSEPDDNAPSAPAGLSATASTSSTIDLSWNESTDDVSVGGYIVYYTPENGVTQSKRVTAPATTVTLDGLSADTPYSIYVQAYDTSNNLSDASNTINVLTATVPTDVTPPTVPANLRLTAITQNSASLAWDASTDNSGVKNYVVSWSAPGSAAQTSTVTGTSATLTGLSANTAYTFSVVAVDNVGNQSNSSASVSGTTLGQPAAGSGETDFSPYVDVSTFAKWATTLPALTPDFINDAIALGIKSFHLAFLVQDPSNPRSPVWGNGTFPLESIAPLVNIIRNAGGEPIFAFGGFSGVDFSTTWTVNELADLYIHIAQTYGVTTIDLDFETAGFYNSSVAFPAFVQARNTVPELEVSVTLPVWPTGLTAAGLDVLNVAAANGLQPYVNIMAMDYGPIFAGDYAIQAINSTKDQMKTLWGYTDSEAYEKIVVTPMIGHNDTDPLVFTVEDAIQVAEFAKQNNLHQVSEWSLGRDFAPGTVDSHGNMHSNDKPTSTLIVGQEDYAFTKAFQNTLSS